MNEPNPDDTGAIPPNNKDIMAALEEVAAPRSLADNTEEKDKPKAEQKVKASTSLVGKRQQQRGCTASRRFSAVERRTDLLEKLPDPPGEIATRRAGRILAE
jgi:hypothetical protein